MRLLNSRKKFSVFFDFDNTIALTDTFDGLLPLFCQDNSWVAIEEEWRKGKIGSLECMKKQTEGLKISRKELDRYLCGIKLDPGFKKLVLYLRKKRIPLVILSDNFDYLIKKIFKHNRIKGVKVLANRLRFGRNKLIPSFPFSNKRCPACGHCKTKNLLANSRGGSVIIYAGDGRTDVCPALFADVVFAKKYLLEHFRSQGLPHLQLTELKEVNDYLEKNFTR